MQLSQMLTSFFRYTNESIVYQTQSMLSPGAKSAQINMVLAFLTSSSLSPRATILQATCLPVFSFL